MRTYQVIVTRVNSRVGEAQVLEKKADSVVVDIARETNPEALNPTELVLTAFGGCLLKNLHKLAPKLRIRVGEACIRVSGERTDTPPHLSRIRYELEIETDASAELLSRLHRYLRAYGTVYNTLGGSLELDGRVIRMEKPATLRKE